MNGVVECRLQGHALDWIVIRALLPWLYPGHCTGAFCLQYSCPGGFCPCDIRGHLRVIHPLYGRQPISILRWSFIQLHGKRRCPFLLCSSWECTECTRACAGCTGQLFACHPRGSRSAPPGVSGTRRGAWRPSLRIEGGTPAHRAPPHAAAPRGRGMGVSAAGPCPPLAMPPLQVIQVWDQIVHYCECTDDELHDVVLILMELLDGTSDTMGPASPFSKSVLTRMSALSPVVTAADRYEMSEFNVHIMECKLAACDLLLVVLNRYTHEELDKIIHHFFGGGVGDQAGLVAQMVASLHDSIRNPGFKSLKERLLPILRDILMYQHNGLVSTALDLIFQLSMMRSGTAALLQVQDVRTFVCGGGLEGQGRCCCISRRVTGGGWWRVVGGRRVTVEDR